MSYDDPKNCLRSTRAIIDLGAIENNLARIRAAVGEQVEILAVVKADAYGHGALETARACERTGAAMLGVAMVEEGVELRNGGVRLPILVQCCTGEAETDAAVKYDLTLTLTCPASARRLSHKAEKEGVTVNVHADIDTGMGRIGFARETAVEEIAAISRLPGLKLDGIYTHFATSEIENDDFTTKQLHLLKQAVDKLSALGVKPSRIHAANSGAVLNYPESFLTLVRPGLILYGCCPDEKLNDKLALRPALKFETSIAFLKDIKEGTPLGYGRTFVAQGPMRIATANVGYADGYPWRLSYGSRAIVRGQLAPVVGRVSMDQLLLDVSSVDGVAAGDTVTLLGRDGDREITAGDLADWAGTIPYEILCGITKRVPRQYIGKT